MKAYTLTQLQEHIREANEAPERLHAIISPSDRLTDYNGNTVCGVVVFTLEEVDSEGQNMTYGNRKTGLTLELNTSDRYESFDDTELFVYFSGAFNPLIAYAE